MDPEQVGGYLKGRERRAIVLESATRVFGSGGFHGATLSAIVTASGISKAGLVHHFPTNTASFFAQANAMSERLERLGVAHELHIPPKSDGSVTHGFESKGDPVSRDSFDRMVAFLRTNGVFDGRAHLLVGCDGPLP